MAELAATKQATFLWEGKDKKGNRVKGRGLARDEMEVRADLRKQGIISIFATLGLILIYVAFRFDLAYAPGAVLCLFHDVMITVGIFILIGKEFNVSMILGGQIRGAAVAAHAGDGFALVEDLTVFVGGLRSKHGSHQQDRFASARRDVTDAVGRGRGRVGTDHQSVLR